MESRPQNSKFRINYKGLQLSMFVWMPLICPSQQFSVMLGPLPGLNQYLAAIVHLAQGHTVVTQ